MLAAYSKERKLRICPCRNLTKFDLIINQATARALGLSIPQAILLRTHELAMDRVALLRESTAGTATIRAAESRI